MAGLAKTPEPATLLAFLQSRLDHARLEVQKEPWKAGDKLVVWVVEDVISRLNSMFDRISQFDMDWRRDIDGGAAEWSDALAADVLKMLGDWMAVASDLLGRVGSTPADSGVAGIGDLTDRVADAEWALADDRELFNTPEFQSLEDEELRRR